MLNIGRTCRQFIKLSECLLLQVNKSKANNTNFNIKKKTLPSSRWYSQTVSESVSDENADINYEEIANGDKQLEHKLKVIALELEVLRQEGKAVPEITFLTQEQWLEAANLTSRSGRRKFFEFLFKLSKKKENKIVKQEQKRIERGPKPEVQIADNLEDFAQIYNLFHNNLFLRFYDSTMNDFYNNRLVQAMQFGQKIVIDCGFESNMSKRENILCSKQLQFLFADNRLFDDPFDVYYCNLHSQGILFDYLNRQIPTMTEPWFPMNLSEGSYLNLFPKEKLVYLTPHCREELTFNHDDIYIIGAIVDKHNHEPLSMAKAKREGIRMAKLPLDRYLQWGSGSGKNLTLNHMIAILNDVKNTGDWNYAFRHVPRRKLFENNAGTNIIKASSDRPRKEKKWIPSSNIDFNNLNFKRKAKESTPTFNLKDLLRE